MFFEELAKLGETTVRDGDWGSSSAQSSEDNVVNIDKFAKGIRHNTPNPLTDDYRFFDCTPFLSLPFKMPGKLTKNSVILRDQHR